MRNTISHAAMILGAGLDQIGPSTALLITTLAASSGRALRGRGRQYQISRSLRFNSADSAYLNKTPAAGTQDKWKLRVNLKRAALGITATIISAASTSDDRIYFDTSDRICWDFAGTNRLVSTQVFRDPSAWYIFEFIYDAANGTAAQKARVFVNGSEITTWTTDTRSSITTGTSKINTNVVHEIGRRANGTTNYFSGYMCDFALIDNSATSGFSGSTDGATGAWNPSGPSGAKWWLKMSNNSSTSTLGNDSGSDAAAWTTNNFSVTAGVGNDSLVDTPTNYGTDTGAGGEVRGNYAIINPLDWATSSGILTNGNLTWSTKSAATVTSNKISVRFPSTGKWYLEITATTVDVGNSTGYVALKLNGTNGFLWWVYSGSVTQYEIRGSDATYSSISTISNGDVIRFAIDMDAGKAWFGVGSTWYLSGDPANGTNMSEPITFTVNSKSLFFQIEGRNGTGVNVVNLNCGQRPFANAAPTGFKALCTQNLPTPAIARGDNYFGIDTYTGTGATRTKTGLRFQPDFAWFKGRSGATDHAIYDSVRGAEKRWESNTADDEVTSDGGLTAFNSDGYTIGTLAQLNTSSATYIAWLAKKGATPGFDIVSYTGNGSNRTISHACGVAPYLVIVKARTTASTDQAAAVWHFGIANTEYLVLNSAAAKATGTTYWNSTSPTSSVFSVGTAAPVNTNSDTYIAYLFAEVAGFSRFGSYTGNGSADGPFVWCGFRPRFVMIKRIDSTSDWYIWDTARDTYNAAVAELLADTTATEAGTADLDILSNGFKVRATTAGYNANTGTFAFMAFAETPFKYARAR